MSMKVFVVLAVAVAVLCGGLAVRRAAAQEEKNYTPEQIRQTDAETFFKRLTDTEEGYHHWAAIGALVEKAKSGGAAVADAINSQAVDIVMNPLRSPVQRWKCCYVLSGIGDAECALPALSGALLFDPDEVVRACAACALGQFTDPDAEAALKDALKKEQNAEVRETIELALKGTYRQRAAGQWDLTGSDAGNYEVAVDDRERLEGNPATSLKWAGAKAPLPDGFGALVQQMKPEKYLGRRVKMSGYVKAKEVKNWAGIWMRVDGADGKLLAFDNMHDRPITGTTEWKKYEIVLDVPQDSESLVYGVLLSGPGQIWVANVKLDPVEPAPPAPK